MHLIFLFTVFNSQLNYFNKVPDPRTTEKTREKQNTGHFTIGQHEPHSTVGESYWMLKIYKVQKRLSFLRNNVLPAFNLLWRVMDSSRKVTGKDFSYQWGIWTRLTIFFSLPHLHPPLLLSFFFSFLLLLFIYSFETVSHYIPQPVLNTDPSEFPSTWIYNPLGLAKINYLLPVL